MNKVVLMGRLTKDPELRYTATNNTAVCSFTLAIDRRFQKDATDFIPIVAWRECAEFCSKWFKKGLRVAVSGSMQTRNWDDAEGKKHYVTEVVADEVAFADGKKDGNGEVPAQQQQQAPPPQGQEPAAGQQKGQPAWAQEQRQEGAAAVPADTFPWQKPAGA